MTHSESPLLFFGLKFLRVLRDKARLWIYSGSFLFLSYSSAFGLRGHRGIEVHLKITLQPRAYCFTSGILSAL